MNNLTLGILTLRSLGLMFALQGNVRASSSVLLMADTLQAGGNIDAHMQAMADNLSAGTAPDWADIERRIRADSDRLHGRVPPPIT